MLICSFCNLVYYYSFGGLECHKLTVVICSFAIFSFISRIKLVNTQIMHAIKYRAVFRQHRKSITHLIIYISLFICFFYLFLVLFIFLLMRNEVSVFSLTLIPIFIIICFIQRYLMKNFGEETIEITEKLTIRNTGSIFNRLTSINPEDIISISRMQPVFKIPQLIGHYKIVIRTQKGFFYIGYNLPAHLVNQLIADLRTVLFSEDKFK